MIKLISYKSIVKYNGHTINDINKALMAKSQQNNADYIAYAERQGQPTPIFIPLTKLQREYQIKKAMTLYYKPIGKLIKEYKQEKEKQDKLTPEDIQKQNTKYHYFFEDEKDEK